MYHIRSINQVSTLDLLESGTSWLQKKIFPICPQLVKVKCKFESNFIVYLLLPRTQKIQKLTMSVSETGPKLVTYMLVKTSVILSDIKRKNNSIAFNL